MPLSQSQEALSDFEHLPWYRDLLASPHITPQRTNSRNPPSPNPNHDYSLFSSTLRTPASLPAMQSFYARVPSSSSPSTNQLSDKRGDPLSNNPLEDAPSDQWLTVASLGTGLNSYASTVHGGLLMTLLDNTMGLRANHASGGKLCLTTHYEADFKRKVKAPCVVLCRAWIIDEEGSSSGDVGKGDEKGKEGRKRMLVVKGRVEDGMGTVYLEGSSRFLRPKDIAAQVRL